MALFNRENAAEYARRGNAALAIIRERKKIEAASPDEKERQAEIHRELRLARVRKQQERIDEMLLTEMDPAKLDRLASAAIRLNEQERQLSGRSLPPTLKANAPTKPKRPAFGLPDPEPGDCPGPE